jgi:hypothetical protein
VDRRIVFFCVFSFTVLSTVLVAAVCLLTEQTWIDTVLYSLATMWLIGIVSQVLVHQVYVGIVRAGEEDKYKSEYETAKARMNIEDIENIDDINKLQEAQVDAERLQEDK